MSCLGVNCGPHALLGIAKSGGQPRSLQSYHTIRRVGRILILFEPHLTQEWHAFSAHEQEIWLVSTAERLWQGFY
jgi:hypothetical protein